jgi:hypothetical protein
MYKITIKGLSGSVNTDEKNYQKIIENGVCHDDFTDYFHKEFTIGNKKYTNEQNLIDKGVSDGYMYFELIDNEIWTVNVYSSKEKLSEDELKQLGKYTQGQWSDGIGEGFEQRPIMELDGKDIYLSPWYYGQKLEINQEEIK